MNVSGVFWSIICCFWIYNMLYLINILQTENYTSDTIYIASIYLRVWNVNLKLNWTTLIPKFYLCCLKSVPTLVSSHQALTDTKTIHKQIWDGQMTEIHLWKKMFTYRDNFIIEVPTQQVQHLSCRIFKHIFTQCSVSTLHWVNESGACIIVLNVNNDKLIDGYDQHNFKNADGDDDHIANYIYIFSN